MFYTPVNLTPLPWKISINDAVITAGSCFADCMGKNFEDNKFSIMANPFGTVYNPVSLHRQFSMSINNDAPSQNDIVENQGVYYHYQFHSSFADLDSGNLEVRLKNRINQVHDYLKNAQYFIITWGTAWAYQRKDEQKIVANCQKQPQKLFDKSLLTVEAIQEDFELFYNILKAFNPSLKIILTISPVRHIKDTLPMNMVSKSILRTAAHHISNKHKDLIYFPAYEIMLDELRDYRFYKEDMIHPTSQAEDYIWNRFKEVALDQETLEILYEWQDIKKALSHRPFNPSSEAHQKFLRNTIKKLEQLEKKIDVKTELKGVRGQLI